MLTGYGIRERLRVCCRLARWMTWISDWIICARFKDTSFHEEWRATRLQLACPVCVSFSVSTALPPVWRLLMMMMINNDLSPLLKEKVTDQRKEKVRRASSCFKPSQIFFRYRQGEWKADVMCYELTFSAFSFCREQCTFWMPFPDAHACSQTTQTIIYELFGAAH